MAELNKLTADALKALASIGCTLVEAAAVFGMSERAFRRRLRADDALHAAWAAGQVGSRLSIRREQMKAARAGNARMLIHLGKAVLGQSARDAGMAGDDLGPELDLGRLEDTEVEELARLIAKATVPVETDDG